MLRCRRLNQVVRSVTFALLKVDKYVEYVMCCEGHDNIPHTTEIPLR